jgi:CheY-like chemotaxis protein
VGTIGSGRPQAFGAPVARRLVRRSGLAAGPGAGPEGPTGDTRPPRRRVMIIEDDAIVRLGLQAVLEDGGEEVILAGSAAEALARLAAGASVPDVIVADYRLRDGQVGTDAIRRVRDAVGRALPAVLLTGEAASDLREEAALQGLLVAGKPIGSRDLFRVIGLAMAT